MSLYYASLTKEKIKEFFSNSNINYIYKALFLMSENEEIPLLKKDYFNDPTNSENAEMILRKMISSFDNMTKAVFDICPQVLENDYCKKLLLTEVGNIPYQASDYDIFG